MEEVAKGQRGRGEGQRGKVLLSRWATWFYFPAAGGWATTGGLQGVDGCRLIGHPDRGFIDPKNGV